jgi:hypothetical protein
MFILKSLYWNIMSSKSNPDRKDHISAYKFILYILNIYSAGICINKNKIMWKKTKEEKNHRF